MRWVLYVLCFVLLLYPAMAGFDPCPSQMEVWRDNAVTISCPDSPNQIRIDKDRNQEVIFVDPYFMSGDSGVFQVQPRSTANLPYSILLVAQCDYGSGWVDVEECIVDVVEPAQKSCTGTIIEDRTAGNGHKTGLPLEIFIFSGTCTDTIEWARLYRGDGSLIDEVRCGLHMGCGSSLSASFDVIEDEPGTYTYYGVFEDIYGDAAYETQTVSLTITDSCDPYSAGYLCDESEDGDFRCQYTSSTLLEECGLHDTGCYHWEYVDTCEADETCNAQTGECELPSANECTVATVTSDCDAYVGNDCVGASCVDEECVYENLTHQPCGVYKHCEEPANGGNSQCTDDCGHTSASTGGKCLAGEPDNSMRIDDVYCSSGSCFICSDGYEWDGDMCVEPPPDCTPTCDYEGQFECIGTTGIKYCECPGDCCQWQAQTSCDEGLECDPRYGCVECDAGDEECVEGVSRECYQGWWNTGFPCPYGCDGEVCSVDACNLVPADEQCGETQGWFCYNGTHRRYCGEDAYPSCNTWGELFSCGQDMACDAQTNQCYSTCVENDHKGCDGDLLYWYDSCGKKGALSENCAADAMVCQDGVDPQCVEELLPCTEVYTYECRDLEGVKIDQGCGAVTVLVTCEDGEVCGIGDDGPECAWVGFCGDPALDQCGSHCYDLRTSRVHCGECGNACAVDELCSAGSCVENPNCVIACRSNAECDEGFVCTNAGKCGLSRCEASPDRIIDEPEENETVLPEDIPEVRRAATGIGDGIVSVKAYLKGREFAFVVQNHGPVPVENVSFKTEFAKAIAQHADHLDVEGAGYEVLLEDPLLRFRIPELENRERFTVTVNHEIDGSYIGFLTLSDLRYDTDARGALEDAAAETATVLNVTTDAVVDDGSTRITLRLSPGDLLGGVHVPVEIPKCMAEYAAELELDGEYEVLQDDPLIAWNFDRLDQATEITFSVGKEIEQECLEQLRSLAWAERIGKPFNPWISLLIIPGLVVLLLFFQHFHPSKTPLSEEEFKKLAREQGVQEHQLDAHWEKFKKEHL